MNQSLIIKRVYVYLAKTYIDFYARIASDYYYFRIFVIFTHLQTRTRTRTRRTYILWYITMCWLAHLYFYYYYSYGFLLLPLLWARILANFLANFSASSKMVIKRAKNTGKLHSRMDHRSVGHFHKYIGFLFAPSPIIIMILDFMVDFPFSSL